MFKKLFLVSAFFSLSYLSAGTKDSLLTELKNAESSGDVRKLAEVYTAFAAYARSKNDFKNALRYETQASLLKDSIKAKDQAQEIAEMQARLNGEERELELKKREQQITLLKMEHEKRRNVTFGVIGIIILGVLAFIAGTIILIVKLTRRKP